MIKMSMKYHSLDDGSGCSTCSVAVQQETSSAEKALPSATRFEKNEDAHSTIRERPAHRPMYVFELISGEDN